MRFIRKSDVFDELRIMRIMRISARLLAIRETSGPETRVSLCFITCACACIICFIPSWMLYLLEWTYYNEIVSVYFCSGTVIGDCVHFAPHAQPHTLMHRVRYTCIHDCTSAFQFLKVTKLLLSPIALPSVHIPWTLNQFIKQVSPRFKLKIN